MGSAILFAGIIEWIYSNWGSQLWFRIFVPLGIMLILLIGAEEIGIKAQDYSERARSSRLPYHDISLMHPSFPVGTYLYFINYPHFFNAPMYTQVDAHQLQGMFYLKYGRDVVIGGSDLGQPAHLSDHESPYVYYYDDQDHLFEQRAHGTFSRGGPGLLSNFGDTIQFEGFEFVNDKPKPGDMIPLIMYWRSIGAIDRNYTVFVHLLNEKGELVSGVDSQPRSGSSPTKSWVPNQFTVDWALIPVPVEVPNGAYYLEIGWYDGETGKRLPRMDAHEVIGDSFEIRPVEIRK
jgi:hypothetical protein